MPGLGIALQLSERFEANYHEMLSHLPVNLLIGARYNRKHVVESSAQDMDGADRASTKWNLRALILGGGDGGVLNRCVRLA